MNYTDAELEAMSAGYDRGLTADDLEGSEGTPGPQAWLLDVIDDWDALVTQAHAENITPEALVRKAVDAYLHAA